ncbi:MAG: hypothetical protein KUG69_15350, partial [Marinosulfonomonas sp.]|nr:hypothetical protein [Marinosulfonomonas sp.]
MSAKYMPAPDVEQLARKLIDTVDRHAALDQAHIEFVFIDQAPRSKGRAVLGRARKLGGLPAFLAGGSHPVTPIGMHDVDPFFVIEIAYDYWASDDFTDAHRVALVDHELCHCRVDEDVDGEHKLSIVGHDVEEFACVVDRHGLWSAGLTSLGKVMSEQLSLGID